MEDSRSRSTTNTQTTSEVTVIDATFREHLARDYRYWMAIGGVIVSIAFVVLAINATLRDRDLIEAQEAQSEQIAAQSHLLSAQTEVLACRSRSGVLMEQADAKLALGIADFVTASVARATTDPDNVDAVLQASADIANAAVELRNAVAAREADLAVCVEPVLEVVD